MGRSGSGQIPGLPGHPPTAAGWGEARHGVSGPGIPQPTSQAGSELSVCPSVRAGGCFSIAPGRGYEHPWSLSRAGRVSTAVGKLRQGAAAGLGRGAPTTQAHHAAAEEENLPWPHLFPAAEDERPEKVGKGDSGAKLGVPGHPGIIPKAPPSSTPSPEVTTPQSPSPPRSNLQEAEGCQGEPAAGKIQAPVVAVLQPLQLQQGQAYLRGQGTELALGSRWEARDFGGWGVPPSPGGRSRSGGSRCRCRGRRRRGGMRGRDSALVAGGGAPSHPLCTPTAAREALVGDKVRSHLCSSSKGSGSTAAASLSSHLESGQDAGEPFLVLSPPLD